MPVVGHAFVGVATAWSVPPRPRIPEREPSPGAWLALLVGLAYLPDIVGHGSTFLGFRDARMVSHSILFAVLSAAALAPLLARFVGIGGGRATALVFGSVVGHDLLDLLQGSDRVLGWPFVDHRVRLRLSVIPENAVHEALWFAAAFLVYLVALAAIGRAPRWTAWGRGGAWRGGAFAALILLAAVGSHVSKTLRDREVDRVEDLLRSREYAEALRRLERLKLWPTLRRSSEVERLAARALVGLGDRAGAEARLLAAERADPDDYRTVADLALFYASSDAPAEERRARAAPYQDRIETEFARRRDADRVLARIAACLAASPSPAPAP